MIELTQDEIFALKYARLVIFSKWKQTTDLPMKSYLDTTLIDLATAFDKLNISEK